MGAFFSLQLGWWGYLLWRQQGQIHDLEADLLQTRRGLAEAEWRSTAGRSEDPGEAWRALAGRYPEFVHLPSDDGGSIQIGTAAVTNLDERARGRRWMILGEGAVFVILSGLGLALFLRVARREAFLILQQSNFLHSVTHELRSPLQSLRLAGESWLRRPDPERSADYARGMLEDVARLETLVENALAVGRLDAEAFRAERVEVDLSRAAETELERFRRRSGLGPEALLAEVEPELRAEADPTTLEPILRNLLDNAVKYGQGRAIRVRLFRDGPYARLEVTDAGRGFSARERAHLFERFWRAGDERVRTTRGVGLGLFLVATLARAQGAAVEATSEGPGRGATFTVSWPLTEVSE